MTPPIPRPEGAPGRDLEARRDSWLRPELVAPWWEVALVLAVMLGPFIYSSTQYAVKNGSTEYISLMLTDKKFLRLMATEALLLTAMFLYLNWRGWKPADFRIRANLRGVVEAPALAFTVYVVNAATVALLMFLVWWWKPQAHGFLAAMAAQSPHIPLHSIKMGWFVMLGGTILNAFLEELVFMGYGFNQFAAKRGPIFALALMVLLRMLLHTYQGPIHVLGIATFSLLFGLVYWSLRRLWPLIMAHALVDSVSFALVKIFFGS
jgi:membrane protease YdiL (CAAX protease family)